MKYIVCLIAIMCLLLSGCKKPTKEEMKVYNKDSVKYTVFVKYTSEDKWIKFDNVIRIYVPTRNRMVTTLQFDDGDTMHIIGGIVRWNGHVEERDY